MDNFSLYEEVQQIRREQEAFTRVILGMIMAAVLPERDSVSSADALIAEAKMRARSTP